MSNIKGLIFDLDGVLVDTAKYHFLAWQRLAKELGIEFTKAHNEDLKGISRRGSIEKILSLGNKTITEDEITSLMAKKNEWYLEYIDQMPSSEILPGVLSILNNAKQLGYKIALGSASKNAVRILKILNIYDLFDVIIDGNVVTRSKPDPEVFTKGAEGLGLKYQECIVFEDASAGIEAGKKAGMKTIGIGNPEILKESDLVLPGFENIDLENDIINKL